MSIDFTPSHWSQRLAVERPPAGRATVTAPFDGAEIATLDLAGPDHVEDALRVAHDRFRDRDAWLPLHERVAILDRSAALMTDQAETLAVEAAREGGKPLLDSRVEVARAIDGVRACIEHVRAAHGHVIPMGTTAASAGRLAFTRREPIGVVVAVSAFNHPLNLIVHQVAAAVAAGCPVIVKPAHDTPLSCLRFAAILEEAGLDRSWCQVAVTESNEVAQRLVTDPRVGFFSFIGSARVGWHLRSVLSPGTRCALEHGGAAPVVLADDADLDAARRAILKGGFYHAGQVCVSVQRVYAPRATAARFARELADEAAGLRVGDPTAPETEVGPLIRPGETARIHQWVSDAGTDPLTGGQPLTVRLYPPTVLLDPDEDADVSRKEIFGPVVCVYGYDALDEAFARANQLPFAFQAAIFTDRLDTALRGFARLDASAVMVNDHTAFRVDGMPFAGLRTSGYGTGGIPYTIDDLQIEKMLVVKSAEVFG